MRLALAKGLVPLFATKPDMASYGTALIDATKETLQLSNMAKVEVLNPTRAALGDFGRDRLDALAGKELPSDTLNYRSTAPGSASRISVQDANILHLRVSYCLRLKVPIMDRVIYAGAHAISPFSNALSANGMQDPFGTHGVNVPSLDCMNPLFRGPRIVIRSEAMVRMQSPFFESNL